MIANQYFKMVLLIALVALFLCVENGQVSGLTGGEPVEEGEFSYMVSIRQADNCHFCGGTIIGDRWILTSSICYSRAWWGSIRFGSTKLDSTNASGHGRCSAFNSSVQRYIDDVLYNPNAWDRPPYTHDLVLIHLNESIPFGENVQPAQLPEPDEPWPYNKTGTILGWGDEGTNNTSWSDGLRTNLQKAQVPLYSDEYCMDSSRFHGWIISDPVVMKCGGEVNKTYYCYNDLGGPLLVDGKQYGIISYIYNGGPDPKCGDFLGIFSPVSYFRQWIRDTTGI